jgi:hypothetical protein
MRPVTRTIIVLVGAALLTAVTAIAAGVVAIHMIIPVGHR